MNDKYKQNFLRAGVLAKDVRAYGKSLIKNGASYREVMSKIKQKIKEVGGTPAFPPQMALNDVAAHFLPMPGEDIVFNNEIVKLDIGVCYEGAIGDCAVTIDLSGKFQPIIDAAEAALLAAEQIIKPGLPVQEIGKVIEATILARGFTPIRNLSGHGLGQYKVHMPPMIPNCETKSTAVLKKGMTFAIEPFATNGKGWIYEAGEPTIFSLIALRAYSSPLHRKLQTKIMSFKGLPFSMDDLAMEEVSWNEIKLGISEMLKAGAIAGYAPLIEEEHGMVAQAENSVLIDNQGLVTISTR